MLRLPLSPSGGATVEACAAQGNPHAYNFSVPLARSASDDTLLSFRVLASQQGMCCTDLVCMQKGTACVLTRACTPGSGLGSLQSPMKA